MLSHKTKLTLKTGAHLIHSHRHHPCLAFHMIQTTTNSVIQDKSLQEIGTYPRGTTTSQLHDTLNIEHIQDFIDQLTAKFLLTVHSILNSKSSIDWKLHLSQPELHVWYYSLHKAEIYFAVTSKLSVIVGCLKIFCHEHY